MIQEEGGLQKRCNLNQMHLYGDETHPVLYNRLNLLSLISLQNYRFIFEGHLNETLERSPTALIKNDVELSYMFNSFNELNISTPLDNL